MDSPEFDYITLSVFLYVKLFSFHRGIMETNILGAELYVAAWRCVQIDYGLFLSCETVNCEQIMLTCTIIEPMCSSKL